MSDFIQNIFDNSTPRNSSGGGCVNPVKPQGGPCIELSMGPTTLFESSREELAWEDYRQLALALIANPKLLLDRPFMGLLARTERRWKHIYTARCACQEASEARS